MSILHFLEDPQAATKRGFDMLKPGGVFVSDTACIAEIFPAFSFSAPPRRLRRLAPYVNIFTRARLDSMINDAGFTTERAWQPHAKTGVFIVARKPA